VRNGRATDDEPMRLRYPPSPHAPTEPDGYCAIDHLDDGWQRPTATEQGVWRVTGDEHIVDDRHGRRDQSLAPGTSLRLDRVRASQIEYPGDGPQWQRGAYEVIERRFCVLDGTMAGTCWESREERPGGSDVPFRGEHVAPVAGRSPRVTNHP